MAVTSEAGFGMVARENVLAGLGGSPVPAVDRECFEGGVAAVARGMLRYLCVSRNQKSFIKDASFGT